MRYFPSRNSISTRLLVTGLIPLTLLSLLMGYYFVSYQRAEMLGNLHDTGQIAVRQVSQNTAFALYSGDRQSLDSLSYATLETPSVAGIVFYSYTDEEPIIIGDIDIQKLPLDFGGSEPFKQGDHWYFFSEILSDRTPIMDYDEQVRYEPEKIGWVLVSLSNKLMKEKELSFLLTAATVVSLSLLLAFWLSIRIGRTVADPLEELTEVVAEMEAGNLKAVASEKGITELAQLSRGINGLATSVRESNQLMQSEIIRATSQLKIALAELEEAMQAKDQFLARMSHELRTPLTAVLGFSNLLFTEDSELKREEQLRVIQRCSTVLLTMIDDLLDFSKADLGGFTLNNSAFELDKFIEDLAALFCLKAGEKGLAFAMHLEDDVPKIIYGDSVRLAQVLTNVVNNAIKFTDSGSVDVHISVVDYDENYDHLKFMITDTGKGIVKDKIPTIFEPFTQEDTSINRQYGGNGLGLSIARRLVNAMNGNIMIESEVNIGTEVIFTCQLAKNSQDNEALVHRSLATAIKKEDKVLLNVSILLAEDNEFNQQLMVKLLGGHGAICSIAKDGQEAIEMNRNDHFDLILMDLRMPIIDGIEATKTIAEQNEHFPPIIGLTADITKAEQNKLIDAGAKAVQFKPIDEIALINTILEAINPNQTVLKYSGEGMLASVLPVADLNQAISDNLDNLEAYLQANEQRRIRPLIHDLLGFCGLYGMSELREIVLEFKASYEVMDNMQNLQQVNRIRQYMKKSAVFK
ncbi:MAG: ATP-binding protein [Porticoccaceae bacterium]|nr:ATP-binding protein [Porticoccaceae bacterium]